MAKPAPVPQELGGISYRSAAVARWAEFFRLTGTPAQYEPADTTAPDFWLADSDAHFDVVDFLTLPERRALLALAKRSDAPVVVAFGPPSVDVRMACLTPDGEEWACVLVEEHKGEGAWVAEFASGGGWAFPLRRGLINCATYGRPHPALDAVGRLAFDCTDMAVREAPPLADGRIIGDWEQASLRVWNVLKRARDRMKRGDET